MAFCNPFNKIWNFVYVFGECFDANGELDEVSSKNSDTLWVGFWNVLTIDEIGNIGKQNK